MHEQQTTHAATDDQTIVPPRPRRRAGKTAAQAPRWRSPQATEVERQLELAADALLTGLTREGVIAALIGRITRDEQYLAYRRACRRRTTYDSQVEADLRALALAVCWLGEERAAAQ
jgi:hypothetical protein